MMKYILIAFGALLSTFYFTDIFNSISLSNEAFSVRRDRISLESNLSEGEKEFIDRIKQTDNYLEQIYKIHAFLESHPLEDLFDFSSKDILYYRIRPISLKRSTKTYLDSMYVSEFGIIDSIGNNIYYYAQYKYPLSSGIILPIGICIFKGKVDEDLLEPQIVRILGNINIYEDSFYKPDIVNSDYGKIMTIRVYLSGNGNQNEHEYFLITDKGIKKIDSESWAKEFLNRHRKWNAFYNGIEINTQTFSATGGIWLENDPHCCPSLGIFKYSFGLSDTTLILKKFVKISDWNEGN
ncbi:MAG TPA: hypothetical protein PK559_07060 [Ignavibacteriaceae bacterium]|nr:hypothetical protein [Ignavibacteriaceae bacterium]